jgi:hypothetical protein
MTDNNQLYPIIKIPLPSDIIVIILSFCDKEEYKYLTTWDPKCKALLENEILYINLIYRKMVPSIYSYKHKDYYKIINEIKHAFSLFKYIPLQSRIKTASMYMNYPLEEEQYPPMFCIEANIPLNNYNLNYLYVAADMGKDKTLIDALEYGVNLTAIAIYYNNYGIEKTKDLLYQVKWKLQGINQLYINKEVAVLLRQQFTISILNILKGDEKALNYYNAIKTNTFYINTDIVHYEEFRKEIKSIPTSTSSLISCIFNHNFDIVTSDNIKQLPNFDLNKNLIYYAIARDNRIDLLDSIIKVNTKTQYTIHNEDDIEELVVKDEIIEINGIYPKIISCSFSEFKILDYIFNDMNLTEQKYVDILCEFLHPRIIEKVALAMKKKYEDKEYFRFIEPDKNVKFNKRKPFSSYVYSILKSVINEDSFNNLLKEKREKKR